jgi:hypothetical protein
MCKSLFAIEIACQWLLRKSQENPRPHSSGIRPQGLYLKTLGWGPLDYFHAKYLSLYLHGLIKDFLLKLYIYQENP